jgi:hypothetical protein
MERLLARLFTSPDGPWRLKGGYAMELRLAGRARTTRDLDLSAVSPGGTLEEALDPLLTALREAALLELGDFLEFAVADPGAPLEAGQAGGFRFPVTASLGGRLYSRFHVDVGLDAPSADEHEVMTCEDHLAFAAIAPARVLLVPRGQQFAEKVHAFTRQWGDRGATAPTLVPRTWWTCCSSWIWGCRNRRPCSLRSPRCSAGQGAIRFP